MAVTMIHTPNQSNALLILINTLAPITFTDCSYKNDECDSIEYTDEKGIRMQIFLPNMIDAYEPEDMDDYSTFGVAIENLQGNNNHIGHEFNLIEVLSLINAFDREFKIFIKGEFRTLTTMDWLQANAECDFKTSIKPMLRMALNDDIFIGEWATERIK